MKTKKTRKNVKYGSGYRGMFGLDRTSNIYCYPFKYGSLKNAIVNYAKRLLSIHTDNTFAFLLIYKTWYNEQMARNPVTNLKQYEHFTEKWGDIKAISRVLKSITDERDPFVNYLADDFENLIFYFRNKTKQFFSKFIWQMQRNENFSFFGIDRRTNRFLHT